MSADSEIGTHPSAFEFDLAVAGESTPAFDAHLATCADCRDRLTRLRWRQPDSPTSSPMAASAQRRSRWLWGVLAALIALAGGLLLTLNRLSREALPPAESPSIEVYVRSGSAPPRHLVAGERLGRDDRVQLACHPAGRTQLTIFTVGSGCEVERSGTLRAPAEGVLPSSWPASAGRLYVAFAGAPVPPPDFAAALRATTGGCEPDRAPDVTGVRFVARGLVLSAGDR